MIRRRLMAVACVLLAASGCQLPQRLALKPSVHIGSTRIGMFLLPADFYALHPQLETLFDTTVLFDPDLSPDTIADHLRAGRRQFAILSAGEFCGIKDLTGLEPIAAGLYDKGGATQKGLIITKKDSRIQTVADCKGKRFAFGPAKDLLYDFAARTALEQAGVGANDIVRELVPPFTLTGRIHVGGGMEVAKAVAFDATIPAGVIDEPAYNALPEKGGSFLTSPSRDMFRLVGVTAAVPGMVVVRGPKTDPVMVEKMKSFLIGRVKSEPQICAQMKVAGFTEPDVNAYAQGRMLIAKQ